MKTELEILMSVNQDVAEALFWLEKDHPEIPKAIDILNEAMKIADDFLIGVLEGKEEEGK